MLIFAIFTLGYFAGVFTALLVFPPRTTELEQQEIDALQPIVEVKEERRTPQIDLINLIDLIKPQTPKPTDLFRNKQSLSLRD